MSPSCPAVDLCKLNRPPGGPARGSRIHDLLLAALATLLFSLPWTTVANQNEEKAEEFFNSTNLITFQIELQDSEYQQLAERPKTYARGRVRVGDQVWEDVGIRLKGSGTFQTIFDHPSLALKFNWKQAEQRFSGLPKLFLENSGQDASRMCKLLANGAYADAGIAAPRITQARVQLNRRDLGRYVVSEAINKNFLKNHFGNNTGNLYEADFRDLNRMLKQANGAQTDQSDLRRLCRTAALTNRTQRIEELNHVLDTEEFLNFLAIEMILGNWDGYAFHQNNYRLYHDSGTDKITFIPHDLDNTIFESGMCLMPPRNGLLTAALLDTPEARQEFRQRVGRLVPTVLDEQKMKRRLEASIARLSQGANSAAVALMEKQAALLEQRVAERRQHIADELAGHHPLLPEFDATGVARLSGWAAKQDWNQAEIKIVTEDDAMLLSIEAERGYCFGSWRLPVWLPAGRYRFEALARASSVTGLPSQTGSGVGVRVIGSRRGSGLQGDCSRWTPVRHEFSVQTDCEWVELIAELRAFSGIAWFDRESLRLTKLK